MESTTSPAGSPHGLRFIFFNDRGLRAGWRLLIYCAMIALLVVVVNIVGRHFAGSNPQHGPQPSEFVMRVIQGAIELVLFLILLFLAWIMSKIEHRRMGDYGLPLQRSLVPAFFAGYFLWGFLPLTFVLLILRACGAFYFGSLSPLNGQILVWAVFWMAFFLLVGLFEEYFFRGYMLVTPAEGIGFWPAAIILAIGFARAHMGNGGETRIGILATAFFALFASATLWRTGNLWLAVGAHAGWDWGQSFFYGVNDSGFQAPGHLLNPHVQGPDWLTGGSVGPEGSVVTLILWMLLPLIFLWLYRRPRPALVITADRRG